MQIFIETSICLLAVLGIIYTTITLFEMFIQKKQISNYYRIFNKNNENNNKKVEIIIHIKNLDKKDEDLLVKKIIDEKEIDLKEISTAIIIQKEE